MRVEAASLYSGDELASRLTSLNAEESSKQLAQSLGGRLGKAMEPVIKPLGFNWKIGIGLVGSLAAREVFVSTMAVVYGIEESGQTENSLVQRFRYDFSPLVGLTIVLFFVLCCQCLATVAVMKRESNSWKWALFMFGYMTVLAYLASLIFYQGASRIWPGLA